MVGSKISVVIPIYFPDLSIKDMSDANILHAKAMTSEDIEWVMVETESQYYKNEADIYIYENNRTDCNKSVNRGFNACSGDYVVFLGNDVKVCEGWVEKMLECFKNEDCGFSSLGNNEHNDPIEDKIIREDRKFFFSVCMLRKEDAWLDPAYDYIFDDTDLMFRLYLEGKKHYKNLSGHVQHIPHSTHGEFGGNQDIFMRNRDIFKEKYKEHKDDPIYKMFVGTI